MGNETETEERRKEVRRMTGIYYFIGCSTGTGFRLYIERRSGQDRRENYEGR